MTDHAIGLPVSCHGSRGGWAAPCTPAGPNAPCSPACARLRSRWAETAGEAAGGGGVGECPKRGMRSRHGHALVEDASASATPRPSAVSPGSRSPACAWPWPLCELGGAICWADDGHLADGIQGPGNFTVNRHLPVVAAVCGKPPGQCHVPDAAARSSRCSACVFCGRTGAAGGGCAILVAKVEGHGEQSRNDLPWAGPPHECHPGKAVEPGLSSPACRPYEVARAEGAGGASLGLVAVRTGALCRVWCAPPPGSRTHAAKRMQAFARSRTHRCSYGCEVALISRSSVYWGLAQPCLARASPRRHMSTGGGLVIAHRVAAPRVSKPSRPSSPSHFCISQHP